MKPRLTVLLFILLATCLLVPAIPGYADTVIRKDGRRIDGEILEDNEDWVIIRTKYGEATIDRELIDKVIRSDSKDTGKTEPSAGKNVNPTNSKMAEYNKKLLTAKRENTADTYVELAKWCYENEMTEHAQAALKSALKIDTDHKEARDLLGYVNAGGKWMLRTEAIRKGYVPSEDGLWLKSSSSSGSSSAPQAAGKAANEEYMRLLSEAEMRSTAASFFDLGKWCRDLGMEAQAKDAFRRAIALDPKHAPAHRALGHELVKGKWMSEDEAKSTGYVRNSDGEWVKADNYAKKEEKRLEKEREEAQKLQEEKQKESEGVPWDQRHILKSKNYELHCNSSKEIAQMYLRVMEALNKKFRKVFAALNPDNRICQVYVHRNQQEFMQIRRKSRGVGGYYQPGRGQLVAFHGTFGMTGSTLTVLAHEGCHQFQDLFMKGRMMSSPIWVIEGMAVIFESADIDPDAGKVELQGLNPDRVRQLQSMIKQKRHISLQQMMATPQSGFGGSHYCSAGAFTWWLLKDSKKKKYRKLYEQYLLALVDGKIRSGRGGGRGRRGGGGGGGGSLDGGAFEKMCEEITGKTVADMGKEWQEYVLKIKLPKYGYLAGDRFVSKMYKFEVERANKYWKSLDENELGKGEMMVFERGKTKGRFSVQVAQNRMRANADYALQNLSQQLAHEKGSSFKMLSKRKRYISGHQGAEFLYEFLDTKDGKSTLTMERRIMIYTNRMIYVIIATSADEHWKKNERDFEKMEESFKIDL
ncbi:MAG: DUF1570 domain-containing protein [Planctomycetota bacterium]|jgi:tetratricopeptide (TPR) repeat protein